MTTKLCNFPLYFPLIQIYIEKVTPENLTTDATYKCFNVRTCFRWLYRYLDFMWHFQDQHYFCLSQWWRRVRKRNFQKQCLFHKQFLAIPMNISDLGLCFHWALSHYMRLHLWMKEYVPSETVTCPKCSCFSWLSHNLNTRPKWFYYFSDALYIFSGDSINYWFLKSYNFSTINLI